MICNNNLQFFLLIFTNPVSAVTTDEKVRLESDKRDLSKDLKTSEDNVNRLVAEAADLKERNDRAAAAIRELEQQRVALEKEVKRARTTTWKSWRRRCRRGCSTSRARLM